MMTCSTQYVIERDQGGGTKAEAMGDIMEKRIKIFGTIECARKSQFKIAL